MASLTMTVEMSEAGKQVMQEFVERMDSLFSRLEQAEHSMKCVEKKVEELLFVYNEEEIHERAANIGD